MNTYIANTWFKTNFFKFRFFIQNKKVPKCKANKSSILFSHSYTHSYLNYDNVAWCSASIKGNDNEINSNDRLTRKSNLISKLCNTTFPQVTLNSIPKRQAFFSLRLRILEYYHVNQVSEITALTKFWKQQNYSSKSVSNYF